MKTFETKRSPKMRPAGTLAALALFLLASAYLWPVKEKAGVAVPVKSGAERTTVFTTGTEIRFQIAFAGDPPPDIDPTPPVEPGCALRWAKPALLEVRVEAGLTYTDDILLDPCGRGSMVIAEQYGMFDWRADSWRYLAVGQHGVALPGEAGYVEVSGYALAGDTNDDNIIEVSDYNSLMRHWQAEGGQLASMDEIVDFYKHNFQDTDSIIDVSDWALLVGAFGRAGNRSGRPFEEWKVYGFDF
jgi:hypothetical protein